MANLFRKHRLLFAIVGGFFILALVIFLAISAQNRKAQKLSTPQLIGHAYVKGEITEEYQLLYLAYAVYEAESLPSRFHGNVPWEGTSILRELKEAAASSSIMCTLSPYVQSELRRLLHGGATCD